jgi:hypothetical protein
MRHASALERQQSPYIGSVRGDGVTPDGQPLCSEVRHRCFTHGGLGSPSQQASLTKAWTLDGGRLLSRGPQLLAMMSSVNSLESRIVYERDVAEERVVQERSSQPRCGFEI